ncbi:MAG: hypothetical protein HY551_03520 [Elusimicrobia bacterium]|nr:hypothetical protein [Elusimicrobiota bacterium]
MIWLWKRPGAALFLLAFVLRAAAAVVTEYRPLFPRYYYTDAIEHDETAWRMVLAWREGRPAMPTVAPGKRLYDYGAAGVYSLFGRKPLILKFINGFAAALAVLLLYRIALALIPLAGARWFGLFTAVWPSHVYFTSQNTKDAAVILLVALSMDRHAAFLKGAWMGARNQTQAAALSAACASLLILGLFKNYLLLEYGAGFVLTCLIALGISGAARPSRYRATLLAGMSACLLTVLVYRSFSQLVFLKVFRASPDHSWLARDDLGVFPSDHERKSFVPRTPEEITEFRRYRLDLERVYAKRVMDREIGTQLFPDLRLRTWWDVLKFMPKGFFYAFFMPLPGFYDAAGSLGRRLAGMENLAIFILFGVAVARAIGLPKRPEHWLMICFFLATAAATALFEFDLGSASRHKLAYLPSLLIFAFHHKEQII